MSAAILEVRQRQQPARARERQRDAHDGREQRHGRRPVQPHVSPGEGLARIQPHVGIERHHGHHRVVHAGLDGHVFDAIDAGHLQDGDRRGQHDQYPRPALAPRARAPAEERLVGMIEALDLRITRAEQREHHRRDYPHHHQGHDQAGVTHHVDKRKDIVGTYAGARFLPDDRGEPVLRRSRANLVEILVHRRDEYAEQRSARGADHVFDLLRPGFARAEIAHVDQALLVVEIVDHAGLVGGLDAAAGEHQRQAPGAVCGHAHVRALQ